MGCGPSSLEATKDVPVGALKGKVALVTGPTAGIGLVTAQVLAFKGAHVVLAGRSGDRLRDAERAIRSVAPDAQLTSLVLDLGSFASVRACAAAFVALRLPLHWLVCNAGIMAVPYRVTVDGFESQFATNHLGHFLLTSLLLPTLRASTPSRIVCVASAAQSQASATPTDPSFHCTNAAAYSLWTAYGNSKLANVLHAHELAKRLRGTGVSAFSLHPGVFPSELGRNSCGAQCFYTTFGCCMKSVDQGAATTLHCALTPGLEAESGSFYADCQRRAPWNRFGHNDTLSATLWDMSERMTQSGPVLPPAAAAAGAAGAAGAAAADVKAPAPASAWASAAVPTSAAVGASASATTATPASAAVDETAAIAASAGAGGSGYGAVSK